LVVATHARRAVRYVYGRHAEIIYVSSYT
jgi:hypothetical protein